MTNRDVHGPIDLVVIEFPPDADVSAARDAMLELIETGTIRLFDLMVVRKEDDGSVSEVDISVDGDGSVSLNVFAGARSGLLGGDDIDDAGALLEPGSMAALLVYENAWAVPFVAAARDAGGEMIASSRLTAQEIMDTLDILEGES